MTIETEQPKRSLSQSLPLLGFVVPSLIKSGKTNSQPGLTHKRIRGVSIPGIQSQVKTLPMGWASLLSVLLHLVSPALLGLVVLVIVWLFSWLLHINLFAPKPVAKHDVEFVLVEDTHSAAPKIIKRKGQFNQQAGGDTDKKRPVKPQVKPATSSRTMSKKLTPPKISPSLSSSVKKPPEATQKNEMLPTGLLKPAEPTLEKESETLPGSVSKPSEKTVSSTTIIAERTSSTETDTANPEKGSNSTPGVDVLEDKVMGPFMSSLEEHIKKNWFPPRGASSQRVLVLFYITRQGRLLHVEVKETSGNMKADEAAIAAIKAAEPFPAFPGQVDQDVLPVEFTFDYNVLKSRK
jgi:TonB family protein